MVRVNIIPQWKKSKNPLTIEQLFNPWQFNIKPLYQLDLDIIDALFRYRFLTTPQIGKLFFSHCKNPQKKAVERMSGLFNYGLLSKYRRQTEKGEGSLPYIYMLSELGFEFLYMMNYKDEEINDQIKWHERDNYVKLSRIAHEIELNNFCIAFKSFIEPISDYFYWESTKYAYYKKQLGIGRSIIVAPDAIIYRNQFVFHIEYERSSDPRRFREKIKRWKTYRSMALWKERYPSEPIILVVGNKNHGLIQSSRSREWKSIDPLLDIVQKEGLKNIYFLYNENWQNGKWDIHNATEQINLVEFNKQHHYLPGNLFQAKM